MARKARLRSTQLDAAHLHANATQRLSRRLTPAAFACPVITKNFCHRHGPGVASVTVPAESSGLIPVYFSHAAGPIPATNNLVQCRVELVVVLASPPRFQLRDRGRRSFWSIAGGPTLHPHGPVTSVTVPVWTNSPPLGLVTLTCPPSHRGLQ
jgi:hypothetical protein